jgi:hypothetical protein
MSTNPHTGQKQQTGVPSDAYRDNWDLIFGKDRKERFTKAVQEAVSHFSPEKDSLFTCPRCGRFADNGHDRCLPPNPYICTKCIERI